MPAPKTAPLGPSWGTATSRQGRGAERVPSVRGRRVLPHSRLSACWSTFSSWRQERPPTWHRAGAPLAACSAGIPIALRAPTLASSGLGSGLLPPQELLLLRSESRRGPQLLLRDRPRLAAVGRERCPASPAGLPLPPPSQSGALCSPRRAHLGCILRCTAPPSPCSVCQSVTLWGEYDAAEVQPELSSGQASCCGARPRPCAPEPGWRARLGPSTPCAVQCPSCPCGLRAHRLSESHLWLGMMYVSWGAGFIPSPKGLRTG